MPEGAVTMARRLDYRWNLRQVLAGRGMFAVNCFITDPANLETLAPADRLLSLRPHHGHRVRHPGRSAMPGLHPPPTPIERAVESGC
jgi:hypothetical protein